MAQPAGLARVVRPDPIQAPPPSSAHCTHASSKEKGLLCPASETEEATK